MTDFQTTPASSDHDGHNADGSRPADAVSRGEGVGRMGPARRVLIVGLDGATFDVLDPLMAEGYMPRLKAAIDSGAAGTLWSTVPPITPAAWTTFLTGKLPGAHGIIDFERYDPATNKLAFNSTRCLDHVRSLWDILGDAGMKVGSINVPMTYPAVNVNGFMISGFETPGPDSDFVFPRELKADVLGRWPDPTLRAKWKHERLFGRRVFEQNLEYVGRSFRQGTEMTTTLGDRFGWDVLMVVLKLVDNLQHKTWKYIDPRWRDRDPVRRDAVKAAFRQADTAIGDLIDYAAAHDATVLIVSDHGHGSLEGKVHPNQYLRDWGYLKLLGGGAQSTTRGRYLLDRLLGRTRKFARTGDVLHDLAVDFDTTRACVMHAGMAGFLYINLKGRQPCGIVEPSEYEALRDELRERFLGGECRAIDPAGREIALFKEVHKPEELYQCTRADQPWLPDLMLIPHDSLAVVRRIRGQKAVRWLPWRRIEGTHRPNGIVVATGPGIKRGARIEAKIVDCAPTVLTLMGLNVPADMQGRVIADLFESPPVIKHAEASTAMAGGSTAPGGPSTPSDADAVPVYSEADLQAVTERLSDLGYLE
jgi:predicted AlkP superfamily phosphohydrolase/phosphomutase